MIEPQFAELLVALDGAGGFGAAERAHRCFLSALVAQARSAHPPTICVCDSECGLPT